MSATPDLRRLARRKTLELSTIGRRSGKPRTVTIWFVVTGERSLQVQHVASKSAQWYRNLCANPDVEVNLGGGAIKATATAITDPDRIGRVLDLVGRKYWTYRLIRLFGGAASAAVAAEITLAE